MMSILKWLSGGIAGMIALVVILFIAMRGDYAVAALVTEDGTLPSREIAEIRLHMRIEEGPPDAQTIVVLHGGAGGNFRSLLGLSGLADTHRVVFYDQRGAGLSERVGEFSIPVLSRANATGIEVFGLNPEKANYFQHLARNSPNRRSHEVRRILALRDRFRASWRSGQCSARPA